MSSPTRQEIKAAIERTTALLEQMQFVTREPIGTTFPVAECDAAVLRAMLETFDEREDFMEAAMRASAHVSKYFPDDKSRVGAEEGDLLILAQVDAYRRLVAAREGKE